MNTENLTDATDLASKAFLLFSWPDYALFVAMFGLSAIIGIYYGCFGNKQATTEDYLYGGKNMNMFPVAMSLIASNLSGVSLLGIPAEIYMNGTQFVMCGLSFVIMAVIVCKVYLPVFYKLQLNSIFEYLQRRFSYKIRLLASFLFALVILLFIPMVIYVPALAFNQVTGIDIYLITIIVSFVCIFYTTLGGLKAVVWTDTLQFTITLLTLVFVLVMGTISVGGFKKVWEKAALGDRLEFFNMNPDPTLRETFWSVVVGQTLSLIAGIGCNPATVQRLMAIPTIEGAKACIIMFAVGTIITNTIMCFSGLIMFAKYFDCDPLSSGKIKKADQILPYYVLDVASKIPGISGLFVAGVFSTAFSTLSTYLNSLSGIIYTDFIAPCLPVDTSEKKASNIMKANVVIFGIICVCLVYIVEKLGTVLQLAITITGMTLGPLLGLFALGMTFPMANETGAIWGSLSSLAVVGLIMIKNQLYTYSGAIKYVPKPFHTYGCADGLNITNFRVTEAMILTTSVPLFDEDVREAPFWLFKISFYYYTLVGAFLAIAVGLLVSWVTQRPDDVPVDPDLLSPFVQSFTQKSSKTTKYSFVEKFLQMINLVDKKNEV